MMQNKAFVLIFVALVFILGGLLYVYNPDPVQYQNPKEEEGAVCAQDAMLCPDGSYVGRSGPNCEFDVCPIPPDAIFEDGTVDTLPDSGVKDPANPVACTMDAMQCPDGTYVGRSGPNCEFRCPE